MTTAGNLLLLRATPPYDITFFLYREDVVWESENTIASFFQNGMRDAWCGIEKAIQENDTKEFFVLYPNIQRFDEHHDTQVRKWNSPFLLSVFSLEDKHTLYSHFHIFIHNLILRGQIPKKNYACEILNEATNVKILIKSRKFRQCNVQCTYYTRILLFSSFLLRLRLSLLLWISEWLYVFVVVHCWTTTSKKSSFSLRFSFLLFRFFYLSFWEKSTDSCILMAWL